MHRDCAELQLFISLDFADRWQFWHRSDAVCPSLCNDIVLAFVPLLLLRCCHSHSEVSRMPLKLGTKLGHPTKADSFALLVRSTSSWCSSHLHNTWQLFITGGEKNRDFPLVSLKVFSK